MSGHRLGFYIPFSLVSFFGVLAFVLPYFLDFSVYWLISWIGLGIFFMALLFEMDYSLSNLLLVVSGAFLTAGIALVQTVSFVLIALPSYPTWSVLLCALLLLGIMKHYTQMGVFAGAVIAGISFAIGFGLDIVYAPIIGVVAGVFIAIFILIALSTKGWNSQVCLGIVAFLLLVGAPAVSFAIYITKSVDISYIVGLPMLSLFGAGLCFYSSTRSEPHSGGHGW